MQDFNHSREQFGYVTHDAKERPVGGGPAIVLSQRARMVLVDQGVRLSVQPIMLEEKQSSPKK
jgi:hypothetical protein